jgi:AmiR/NasT family two-component response regulator
MEHEGMTEGESFARLRRASQVSGQSLKVIADAIVAALG